MLYVCVSCYVIAVEEMNTQGFNPNSKIIIMQNYRNFSLNMYLLSNSINVMTCQPTAGLTVDRSEGSSSQFIGDL